LVARDQRFYADAMNAAPEIILARLEPILLDIAELAPLEQVAERLAAAASDLTSAPFAAIGVYGAHGAPGDLARFITHGMDANAVALMPHLPRGGGLLGEVAKRSAPVRVDLVSDHAAASGVPAGHPVMGPYLGVPVMRGRVVIGAFYVTRPVGGAPFTEEDEHRLQALAPYAAVAMSNAMVHELELRRAECAEEIVRASVELQAIEDERACANALSRSVERLFPSQRHLVLIWPEGGADLDGPLVYPNDSSLADSIAEVAESLGTGQHWLEDLVPDHQVLVCVAGHDRATILALACDYEQHPTEVDQLALTQLADIGTIALSSVRRQAAARAVERYRIRDAIARDLHDDLIQSIYSVGLGLQTSRHDPNALEGALDGAVEALGEVIRDLRAYIAQLERGVEGLTSTELLATRIAGQLRSDDRIRWSERIELGPASLGKRRERQLYLIVREAISNIRRHSHAERASVTLLRRGDVLELEVADDGQGFDRDRVPERSVGLRSMEERVADIGGSIIIESAPNQGAILRATFPLDTEVSS